MYEQAHGIVLYNSIWTYTHMYTLDQMIYGCLWRFKFCRQWYMYIIQDTCSAFARKVLCVS